MRDTITGISTGAVLRPRIRRRILLWAFLIFLPAVAAGPVWGADEQADRKAAVRERLIQRVESYIILRFSEELQLNPDEEEKFILITRRYFSEKRDHTREQYRIMKEISDIVKNYLKDTSRLEKLLEQLQKNREKQSDLETQFFRNLGRTLTPLQQAKLVLAWPRIQGEVRRVIDDYQKTRGKQRNRMQRPQ